MGWLEETPDKESKVALLVALRDITDGKIFVEAERAKLTRMLAKVKKKRRMVKWDRKSPIIQPFSC